VFLRFTNHEHQNHDALMAVTKPSAALFLFRTQKTWNIFASGESTYRWG
jgi:hypothetical protein